MQYNTSYNTLLLLYIISHTNLYYYTHFIYDITLYYAIRFIISIIII